MFISEFLGDANFCLASFTILIYLMINYINKIDCFRNREGYRSNWFTLAVPAKHMLTAVLDIQ